MVVTVVKHTEIYIHVTKLIGDHGDGSGSISKTLNENDIDTILTICNLSSDVIRSLAYKVSNKKTELSKGHHILL